MVHLLLVHLVTNTSFFYFTNILNALTLTLTCDLASEVGGVW